ncbi:MAG: 50S ribosomal protein L9 [Flavobacteriia bacterium]|nr:50S ribosomal protein L9 [Flavobacteriia bacterium]
MDVILKQDVENLGFEFEVVSVKPGYARNFLIPQGKAVVATPQKREELNKTLEARKAEEDKMIAEAKEKSAKLEGLDIKIEAKVGAGTKLFGSVNNADLAEALNKAGVEIEKKHIKIAGNTIKRLGKSSAKIRFHRDVEVEFEFEVIPDQDSIKRAEAAAQAKAEVARMDAERAAAAEKSDELSFKYDNPLAVKEPKKEEPKAEAEEAKPAEESTSEEA